MLSKEELAARMTEELQHRVGHEDCSFGIPVILREFDESGCNWDNPTLRRSGRTTPECEQEAHEVINWARKKFNVAE